MTYPLPNNITGLLSLATYTNTVTNGHFGWLLLFGINVVIFLGLNEVTTFRKAWLSVSFLNAVLTALFFTAGLVNGFPISLAIGSLIGAVIYAYVKKDN